ncbi:MAG: dienelactone hydrolase family protein [Enhydrobacter sp.]|nr:MAG: dienelactone hydrolase family protein [Enhydrobacter sp.]
MMTMHRLPAIAVFVALSCGSAVCQAQAKRERLEIDTAWRGQSVTLRPEMHIPSTPGPHGTVLVLNSSAGANDIFLSRTPDAFAKLNLATVVLDTYTPRGVGNTIYDQMKVTTADMNSDALKVFERLKGDARVKPGKIAVMGHSKGGLSAVFLASAGWYTWAGFERAPNFGAAVALAPDCSLQVTGFMQDTVPHFLSVMGEKDDYTVPAPCVALFQRAKAEGKAVEFHLVKGANHGFSTGMDRYDSQIITLNGCADDPIVFTTSDRKGVSMSGKKEVAVSDVFKVCGRKGAHVGGTHEAVGDVLDLVGKWLVARGW